MRKTLDEKYEKDLDVAREAIAKGRAAENDAAGGRISAERIEELIEEVHQVNRIDREAAERKLAMRLDVMRLSRRMRRRWLFVGGVAAAMALFFVAQPLLMPEEVVEEGRIEPRREIAIGAPRARLIISDGTSVDLSSDKRERIITDGAVNVTVDSVSLSYEGNEEATDTVFHTVEVPRGGEFHLTLGDGTMVWLNAESRLTYPSAFGKGERRVWLEGEGYFEVKEGKGRFVVDAEGMRVRVLGTAFNVNAYGGEPDMYTTLVRGKVEIEADGEVRTLTPGEQAIWDRESGEVEVRAVNTYLYTQWMKGQFVFRDAALRDIMKTLARWYEMEYEFADPEVADERFYGIINRFEHVENLLEQFEKTGKVHFEYERNKVIVKK